MDPRELNLNLLQSCALSASKNWNRAWAPGNSGRFTSSPAVEEREKTRAIYTIKLTPAQLSDIRLAMWSRRWLPMRPDLVSSLFGAIPYEEPCCAFCEGRGRRHRDRIRSDCRRHRTRDHRRRTGRRNVTLHQLQHDLDESEISCRELKSSKGLRAIRGPFHLHARGS